MTSEIKKIFEMVSEGKITPEEGAKLVSALNNSNTEVVKHVQYFDNKVKDNMQSLAEKVTNLQKDAQEIDQKYQKLRQIVDSLRKSGADEAIVQEIDAVADSLDEISSKMYDKVERLEDKLDSVQDLYEDLEDANAPKKRIIKTKICSKTQEIDKKIDNYMSKIDVDEVKSKVERLIEVLDIPAIVESANEVLDKDVIVEVLDEVNDCLNDVGERINNRRVVIREIDGNQGVKVFEQIGQTIDVIDKHMVNIGYKMGKKFENLVSGKNSFVKITKNKIEGDGRNYGDYILHVKVHHVDGIKKVQDEDVVVKVSEYLENPSKFVTKLIESAKVDIEVLLAEQFIGNFMKKTRQEGEVSNIYVSVLHS